jgi:hypothetical protein
MKKVFLLVVTIIASSLAHAGGVVGGGGATELGVISCYNLNGANTKSLKVEFILKSGETVMTYIDINSDNQALTAQKLDGFSSSSTSIVLDGQDLKIQSSDGQAVIVVPVQQILSSKFVDVELQLRGKSIPMYDCFLNIETVRSILSAK